MRPGLTIAGVVLNRVASPRHEALIRDGMAAHGVAVLGALPRRATIELPERHLGLVQAGETVTLFRSHNPNYADGGQMRDFVYVDDVVNIIDWLLQTPDVSGVFNAGSGQARSFADLARATFAAAGKEASIAYVDMPEAIRDRYQYFTEASMDRIRAVGFGGQSTPLEEGVRRYVQDFLSQPDPYR